MTDVALTTGKLGVRQAAFRRFRAVSCDVVVTGTAIDLAAALAPEAGRRARPSAPLPRSDLRDDASNARFVAIEPWVADGEGLTT